jgi:phosphoribosylanthranilate isomerase
MTTRIKICGVTTPDDARLAAELGAFAVGMIFWEGSPRNVSIDTARAIVAALPRGVDPVGVFVDETPDTVREVAHAVGLAAVQLHGHEDVRAYSIDGCKVMKAIAIGEEADVETARALPSPVLPLLDAHDPVKRGGTGRTIDWGLAARVAAARPIVLSGGLHACNVAEAIRAVHPYAVDVSSGVEYAPGRKDPARLRALFAAVGEL